jgi:signal transduction histidine kinase
MNCSENITKNRVTKEEMQKITNLFILLFYITTVLLFKQGHAQNNSIDKSACGEEFKKIYTDELSKNNDQAIALCLNSMNASNDKCKAEKYRLLAECYGSKLMAEKQLYYLTSGLKFALQINYTEEIIRINLSLFEYYLNKNDNEKALTYLNAITPLLNEKSSTYDRAGYYSGKAAWFNKINQQDSNLHYLNQSLQLYEDNKDTLDISITLNNIGNLYVSKANYKEAIVYLLKSIQYAELIKDKQYSPGTLLLLANCYREISQYQTAEKYINKAKQICIETNNQVYLYLTYFLLAKNSVAHFENDKAAELNLRYADSALILARLANDEYRMASSKALRADVLLLKNENVLEAERDILAVLQVFSKLGLKAEACYSNCSLGRFYLNTKRYLEAKKYLNSSLILANQLQLSKIAMGLNSMLSKVYEHDGDYKKALYHHQQFYQLQDSLQGGKLKANLAELEKKYSIEKKETEIANLSKEKQLKEADLKQANTRQKFFLVTSILMAAFIFTGLWAYQKLRKNKNTLDAKNMELDNLNQVKNRLFSIIAHDVKGLAIPFQRASRILNHHIQKQNFEKTVEVAKQLETNAESLSNLLDNLLQWSLEQMNGYTPKPELLSLKKEIGLIIESYEGHAQYKNTALLQDIPDDLSVETDKGAFHVVFRNLVANAIKYTENGSINIKAQQEDKNIICHVKDTGMGINARIIDKLFGIEADKIKNGTAGEKGSGLGLVLVKKFLEINGGSVKVNSIEGKGTDFTISFPLKGVV